MSSLLGIVVVVGLCIISAIIGAWGGMLFLYYYRPQREDTPVERWAETSVEARQEEAWAETLAEVEAQRYRRAYQKSNNAVEMYTDDDRI